MTTLMISVSEFVNCIKMKLVSKVHDIDLIALSIKVYAFTIVNGLFKKSRCEVT